MGDSAASRLALFRSSLGQNQRDFADSLGVSKGTVAFIESGERLPSRAFLLRISDRYGVNADWLLNGHGEMLRPPGSGFEGRSVRIEVPDLDMPGHGDIRIQEKDYTWVRRANLSISAGNGIVPLPPEEEDGIVLPNAWLQKFAVNPDLCRFFTVRGDSMAPTIPDGALILIHLLEKTVEKEGVYAFVLDDHLFIKRLVPAGQDARMQVRAISIVSDNPTYPPKILVGNDINGLRIVGRVHAVFSKV
jgi:phage repressor protein C with HTH and peptisase S24 domain